MSFFEELINQVFDYFVESFGVLGLGVSILLLIVFMIIQAIIAPIASEAVLSASGGIFYETFGQVGIFAAIIGGFIGSILGALTAFAIARWVQKQIKIRIVDVYKDDGTVEHRDIETELPEIKTPTDGDQETKEGFMERVANFLAKFIDEDSEDFISIIEEKGFLFVLIGRILPFIPFDAVSYGAGLTRIRFKDFIIATLIGTVPRVIFYVLVGTQLADALTGNFEMFMLLFAGIVLIILGLYKFSMDYLREQYKTEQATPDNVEITKQTADQ